MSLGPTDTRQTPAFAAGRGKGAATSVSPWPFPVPPRVPRIAAGFTCERRSARFVLPAAGSLEPALLLGQAGGLHAVARPELLDRGGEVVAHGALREGEGGRDVANRRPVGGGREHVALPLRQGVAALA